MAISLGDAWLFFLVKHLLQRHPLPQPHQAFSYLKDQDQTRYSEVDITELITSSSWPWSSTAVCRTDGRARARRGTVADDPADETQARPRRRHEAGTQLDASSARRPRGGLARRRPGTRCGGPLDAAASASLLCGAPEDATRAALDVPLLLPSRSSRAPEPAEHRGLPAPARGGRGSSRGGRGQGFPEPRSGRRRPT